MGSQPLQIGIVAQSSIKFMSNFAYLLCVHVAHMRVQELIQQRQSINFIELRGSQFKGGSVIVKKQNEETVHAQGF